jgi:DNA-binding FadR family transcriptional regulator
MGAVHASDDVFDRLAAAIFRGDYPAGSPLPSERTLSADLVVSRATIRQAIHKLAELGLVVVKQGGATIVQRVDDATDVRVIGLLYRLRGPDAALLRTVREKQFMQGFAIVDIAARRARPEDLEDVCELVEEWSRTRDPMAAFDAFEESFWRALARAGGNRIYVLELSWWYELLREHPALRYAPATPAPLLIAFYREVARRLADGDHAARYYHDVITALFAEMEKKP